jgi:hypothetical protein
LKIRLVDGGDFASFEAGRIGRGAKFPPQLGHWPLSFSFTQSRQNVHSNVQIIASVAAGGKSLSQHSQLGRSSSMIASPLVRATIEYRFTFVKPPARGFIASGWATTAR